MSNLFQKTDIAGCFIFQNTIFRDQRGLFTKTYSEQLFKEVGLNFSIAEVFFSNSHKNVIRGMHFQTPPHDQAKVVTCLAGRILDVVLDLRKSSVSYGKAMGIELTGTNEKTIYIPKGCAHGFYSYEDNSMVCYAVESNHHKDADKGVLWSSFGFKWPAPAPVLSVRDQQFPIFQEFESPF